MQQQFSSCRSYIYEALHRPLAVSTTLLFCVSKSLHKSWIVFEVSGNYLPIVVYDRSVLKPLLDHFLFKESQVPHPYHSQYIYNVQDQAKQSDQL